MIQPLKYMKNVSMTAQKSQLSHMSATQQKMMSRLTVADDLKSSSERSQVKEQFQEIIKVSKWSHHEKIKDYELTNTKEC